MPLYATKLALDERVSDGTNAGFLRDDALLAIVILTDEDDCSREDDDVTLPFPGEPCTPADLESPQRYVDFLDTLTGDRAKWAVAVIAGPTACSSEFGDAVEATRLKTFVDATGQNAVFSSICEGDLSIALIEAVETFDAACQDFPVD